jgi:hypothetical protein
MRRLILVAVVALGLGGGLRAASASAMPDPESAAAAPPPPPPPRKVEVLTQRPSGFWTSNRPATGGAYRWRLLGIGVVLASGAGLLMWRLTRRANAERLQRTKAP